MDNGEHLVALLNGMMKDSALSRKDISMLQNCSPPPRDVANQHSYATAATAVRVLANGTACPGKTRVTATHTKVFDGVPLDLNGDGINDFVFFNVVRFLNTGTGGGLSVQINAVHAINDLGMITGEYSGTKTH